MSSWLITGSNKGIGFAIVETLLKNADTTVIATARNPASFKALQDLAKAHSKSRLAIIQLDITSSESISKAVADAAQFLPNGLDYLINNAGVYLQPISGHANMDMGLFLDEVKINTIAPTAVTRAFLPLIRKSTHKKIVFISSSFGSLGQVGITSDASIGYSVSKAALNMLSRKLSASLKPEGITVISLHPGWVMTHLGDLADDWVKTNNVPIEKITTEESSAGIIAVAEKANLESSTAFWNYDGTIIPW